MKRFYKVLVFVLFFSGCANYEYPSQVSIGDKMIKATGKSLEGNTVVMQKDFKGQE